MSARPRGTLLCSTNFPAGTGYAWDFIESLYAGVADRLAPHGIRTVVAYPEMDTAPRTLEGSAAEAIRHEFRPGPDGATGRAVELVRHLGADVLYMADRPAWHAAYSRFRRAGVRGIVVHDHTSGDRTAPTGARRFLKRARNLRTSALADRVLAVSDFVARRKVEVDLVPPARVTRVWNSVVLPPQHTAGAATSTALADELGVARDRPIVLCVCRASENKGIDVALRAFDRLGGDGTTRPVFVHAGDGPELDALRALKRDLARGEDIHLLGYRSDVPDLIDAASVCLATSVWAEAFGLAALEPMSRARAVIASDIGGLPEVVMPGETGLLVPPGDDVALASSLRRLLADPSERERLGAAGRARAEELFGREEQLAELARVIGGFFGVDGAGQ